MRRRTLALALVLAGCGDGPGPVRICTVGAELPDYVEAIGCSNDYALLGYEDDPFVTFARTNSISVIVDRQEERVYFLDTERWWLHFDFVYYVLGGHPVGPPDDEYRSAHQQFNTLNYYSANRRYILGKIVQYQDQGLNVYSLAAGDRAGADLVVEGFEAVAARLYDGEELRFRPVSNDQEKLIPELEGRVPVITSAELFAGQTFQPLNAGVGYGFVRFRKAAQLEGDPVLPVDLVVLDRVPNDISVVSAIITGEFQTPLSHVNILAKNRGTPNMALRDAWTDPTLRAHEGQLVKLTVTGRDYTVEPAQLADAQAYWDSIRPAEALIPQHDLTVGGFVDLAAAGLEDITAIGAKAANFAEMTRVFPVVRLPLPASAVPFSAFDAHLTAAGLWPEVEAIVAERAAGTLDDVGLQRRLFALRWALYQAPLDPAFRDALAAHVQATWGTTKVRFRSSTNVEDLKSFSGAGLYTSVGASLADGPGALENGIKVVWASVYNYAAFVEREFYRVDQRQVMMAVLVHAAFEDELANGVALTINEFSDLRPAFYINAQVGEISVANPTGEAVPEQILWYTLYQTPEYEVLSRSSLTAGAPVLADAEYGELAGQLTRINAHFRWLHCRIEGTNDIDPNCALDVEWKLAPDHTVYLKQVRPLRGAN